MPVSARTLQMLIDAGLSGDALVAVVNSIDGDMQTVVVDEQAERRRAADRERARVRRLSADSPQTGFPPKEKSPTPPKENTPLSLKENAREQFFERLVAASPKRKGSNPHKQARERFYRFLRNGADAEDIIAAAGRWRVREVELGNEGTKYTPMLEVWLNREEWTEKQPAPFVPPKQEGVFVEHESDAWQAWTIWYRQQGKLMPPPIHRHQGKEGRFMPSLYPPATTRAA